MRILAPLCLLLAATLPAADLYLAPNGDDHAPGTKERPLRSLEAARDRLRALGAGSAGSTVWLRAGAYPRTRPFELTAADTGTIWRAAAGEAVRITAGVTVPAAAMRPVTDVATLERLDPAARGHVVEIDAKAMGLQHISRFPEVFGSGGGILELYSGGHRLPLSRWPNLENTQQRYTHMVRVTDPGDWGNSAARHGGTFVYADDRPARWLKALPGGVWVAGFWRVPWTLEKVRVQSIDTAARRIVQAAPVQGGIGSKYHPPEGDGKEPWYALNLLEEIDTPGEWSLDFSSGKIYLWPPSAGPVTIADMEGPLVLLRGASRVKLQGLVFEGGLGNGVEIREGAENLVAGATFRNLGKTGVVIAGGTHHGVQSCDLYELGEGGVALSGGDRKLLTPARHFVVNNHFHHLGQIKKTYAPAIDIAFGATPAVGMYVAHNLIHDLPHAAVLYSGNDHLIELNEVHNVALESGDVGAFYTTNDWTSRGNVLRHNYVHHASGANAFYMDDGDSGDSILGNVIYRTGYGPFIGGGHDNIVRGNYIIEANRGIHLDARGVSRHYDTTDKHKMGLLASVDYRSAPWSERYPELLKVFEHPEQPTGNVIEDNTLAGCREPFHFDREIPLNTVRNNRVLPAPADFRALLQDVPFAQMGLQQDEYRRTLPTAEATGANTDHREQSAFDSDTDRQASDLRAAEWQARSFRILRETGKLTVGYLGGSITAGSGASKPEETSYRARTTRWLREQFPQAEIKEINAALGGTGSDLGVFRTPRDLLAGKPDLVFVEFAVNDNPGNESRVLRSMEGIVRQILRANPASDIVFLYTIQKTTMAAIYDRGELPPTVRMHQKIAAAYGIPALNIGKTLWERARAGTAWETLLPDNVHPSDVGYAIYIEQIRAFLEAHRADAAVGSRGALPAPVTAGPLEEAHLVDVTDLPAEGWSRTDEAARKYFPHSIATSTPGATFDYAFEGTAIGLFWVIAPDSGDLEWSIDGAPAKRASSWDSYALRFSRKNYTILADSLPPGAHKLTLRVLAEHHAQSQGTALRIGGLLVNGPPAGK